jgi:hypothetical protein
LDLLVRAPVMCTGCTVRLSFPGGERRYQLVAPYCRVEAL